MEFQRALAINPNFAAAVSHLGHALALDGKSEEALPYLEQALRMSSHDPQNFLVYTALAQAHYMVGRYAEAVDFSRKAVQQRPEFTGGYRIFVASLAQAGQLDDAHGALQRLKSLQPDISIAWVEQNLRIGQGRWPKSPKDFVKRGWTRRGSRRASVG